MRQAQILIILLKCYQIINKQQMKQNVDKTAIIVIITIIMVIIMKTIIIIIIIIKIMIIIIIKIVAVRK